VCIEISGQNELFRFSSGSVVQTELSVIGRIRPTTCCCLKILCKLVLKAKVHVVMM